MCRSVRSTVSMRAPECSTSTPTSAWIVVRANRPAASRRSTGKAIYPTINTSIWGQRRLFPPSPAGPSGSAGFAGWCRSGGPDRSRHASGRGYPGGVPLVAGDEHTTPNAIRRPRPAVLSRRDRRPTMCDIGHLLQPTSMVCPHRSRCTWPRHSTSIGSASPLSAVNVALRPLIRRLSWWRRYTNGNSSGPSASGHCGLNTSRSSRSSNPE